MRQSSPVRVFAGGVGMLFGRMIMVVTVTMVMRMIMVVSMCSLVPFFLLHRSGHSGGLMQLALNRDIDLGRLNATAAYPGNAKLSSQPQRSCRSLEQIDGGACIDQRAHQHVAADAGEALQVSDPHRSQSPVPEVGMAKPVSTSMGSTSFMDPERYPSQSRET